MESFHKESVCPSLIFFYRILLSRPFRFIVDAEEVPITVYGAAVAQQSPALAALVQGNMSEGLSGEARWGDVNKGTFLRFIQFAYTGDYSIPVSQSCNKEASDRQVYTGPVYEEAKPLESLAPYTAVDDWGNWGNTYPKKEKDKKKKGASAPKLTSALDPFSSLSYLLPKPQTNLANAQGPCISDGPGETSFRLALAHASLYVLAEKWGIDNLKQLTLFKIYETLVDIRFDASNVQDLVDLVRYIYSNERTPDLEFGIDKLRELICYYIVTNSTVTSEHAAFAALLKEEGDLASDLWKMVGTKFRHAE